VPRAIVELGVRGWRGETVVAIGASPGLPGLTKLVLEDRSAFEFTDALVAAPVIERIECVRFPIDDYGDHAAERAVIAALAERAGALRTIEVRLRGNRRDLGWVIRLERTAAPAPFTRVTAWQLETERFRPKDLANDCAMILGLVDPAGVRELDLDIGGRLPPELAGPLVARLARMPALARADVPWL
jgi:hypothetical protein